MTGSVRQQRFRKILVGAQVALSVTLLAGAALLITSFVRLNQQNVGYHYRNVWVGFVTLPTAQYSDIGTRQRFVERLLASLRAVPGFESVTVSGDIPLLPGGGNATLYSRADGEVLPVDKRATAPSHDISPGYFKTWGIPVLAGRDFDEHDTADHRNVVLISQSGAKKVFGSENPIGKTLLVTSFGTPCEIVVRMALGARTRDVLRMVVNQGMRPVAIGWAIGIASAFALGRLITSQLYEVSAHNPALLAGSTVLLAAIALIACLLPARRAIHVDPIQALRTE